MPPTNGARVTRWKARLIVESSPTTGPFDAPHWENKTSEVILSQWTIGREQDLDEWPPEVAIDALQGLIANLRGRASDGPPTSGGSTTEIMQVVHDGNVVAETFRKQDRRPR